MCSRPIVSLFVCAMVFLCPAFCLAESAAHAAEHTSGAPENHPHEHSNPATPHHHHSPDGEPLPATPHMCICTSAAPSGSVTQVPALELCGGIFAQAQLVEWRSEIVVGAAVEIVAPLDHIPLPCTPLLI